MSAIRRRILICRYWLEMRFAVSLEGAAHAYLMYYLLTEDRRHDVWTGSERDE